MNIIKIKIQDPTRTFELEMPPKASLLKETLKALHTDNKHKSFDEKISFETEFIPETILKEFHKNKGFDKLFPRLKKDYDDYVAFTTTVSNKISVDDKESKQFLDRKEFNRQLDADLDVFWKKNIKVVVMNVSANIPDEDIAYISDMITQKFSHITIIKYYQKDESHSTRVNCMVFGANLFKESAFDRMFK